MALLWWFEGLRMPILDTAFSLITRFGEEMSLIAIFCLIYWCINKKTAYIIGYSFFLSGLVVQWMKTLFRVPRPWVYDPTFEPVGGAVTASTGYAFPSGHTQTAAALLGSIGIRVKQNWFKVILYALALLVGFSRIYLGVHYLEDVLVSLVITFIIIIITNRVFSEGELSKKTVLILSAIMIIFSLVAIGYATYLYQTQQTVAAQLRDSTRVAGAAIGFAISMYIEQFYIKFSPKTKYLPTQVVKLVIGIAGMIAVQEGFRLIGTGLVMDSVRYFLVVMWAMIIYPLIIRRFFELKMSQTDLIG